MSVSKATLLSAGGVQNALLGDIGVGIAVENGLLKVFIEIAHQGLIDERADDAVIVQFLIGDLETVSARPFLLPRPSACQARTAASPRLP